MSADNSDCSKKRVLSAEKRGEFEGKLIVLSEGAKETSRDKFHDRPAPANKSLGERPQSGTLEVLNPGRESGCYNTELNAVRTLPSRLEKKLPSVTRKNDKEQPRINVSMCKHDSELNMKVNHLAIGSVPNKDYESLELKTARVAPQHQMNESQPLLEKNKTSVSLEKVPIELLGMFLDALMKKDYTAAQKYCDDILLIEPAHSTCCELRAELEEKLASGIYA